MGILYKLKRKIRALGIKTLCVYLQRKDRDTLRYVESDAVRYSDELRGGAGDSIIQCYMEEPSFRWTLAFRLCSSTGFTKKIGYVMLRHSKYRDRIAIPVGTQIGYGLYIGHGGPVVVSRTAQIGNNCNLSQFTTIGSNDGKAAVIGDNVYIGPNVCIVENVIIGNNVTIGAGSVVTKDIPDNATIAGNYAKVLNYNNPGRYIRNRWEAGKN